MESFSAAALGGILVGRTISPEQAADLAAEYALAMCEKLDKLEAEAARIEQEVSR
jgi:hypothetical protein